MLACIGAVEPAVWQPPWVQDLSHAGVRLFFGAGWQVAQSSAPWCSVADEMTICVWQSTHSTGPKLSPEMVTVCEAGAAV